MFAVKAPGQNLPEFHPIHSGVSFAFIDKPLHFLIGSDGVPEQITVDFTVKIDSSKKPFEFAMSGIEAGKKRVDFWNPSSSGPSGLTMPISLLIRKPNFALGFMFMVDRIGENSTYRLTYEFYEGVLPHEGGVS